MQHGNGQEDAGWPDPTRRFDDPGGGGLGAAGGGRILGGRYRLEGWEGSEGTGGVSEVYRGTDLRLDRPVAVKLFRAGTDRDTAHRFTDEAHTLANLSHPGLVSVYDSGIEGDQPYLVMELVSGWHLREVLDQEQLPLDEVTRIGAALADVLGYVHQRGVVHRDVTPSNVLIGRDSRVRLTDFGVAQPVHEDRPVFDSPAYLSPEQVRGDWVGAPTDVYALGLVLLEAVTGRVEYPGGGRAAAEARLTRSPEVPADLPANLRRALLAMTDPDPGARPTAAQAASMLELEPEPMALAQPASPARNKTTAQILAIALGALLLAALIGFVALATGDDRTTSAQPSTAASATRSPATTARPTKPTEATEASAARATPKVPTSGLSLPSVPNIELPDAPDISGSVMDEVKKTWQKFTDWLASLF